MKIGNIEIENPIVLAPMAGVTDYPFRILCKEMGAGIVYSEFVSADGIIRENTKTLNLIRFEEAERPIGIQIFGSDAETMSQAARYVVDTFKPDILDINYGCPVPKVTKKGGGSAALQDLCLMDDITAAVVESIPEIPVTVKMRMGWNQEIIVIPEAGERLEKIGVKAIALHPRTTKQRYTGKADWHYIKLLKESCSIPIIGNGDVCTTDDMMRMFEETGCDAVMVGRVAHGNPWFFREANARLKGEKKPNPPSLLDIAKMCNRHFDLLLENRGERIGTNLMRKHFSNYIKGFPGASIFRQKLVTAPGLPEMRSALNEFMNAAKKMESI
ncbi:tRNA dihydrouridine synthase DusB [bacterium]|nr:tRNA dihydrouridine synthase DusB [Candidatus Neomarinimicrobiota bacterium]MDC0645958.1 tRNA dihydrouridine synthase DusB [bacterium]